MKQPYLTLNLPVKLTEDLSLENLPDFCTYPIQYASSKLITIPEGQILDQSFSHKFSHINLLEYNLQEDATISYTVDESSIVMLFIITGSCSCALTHYHPGVYKTNFTQGNHKLLMFNISLNWLLEKLPELPGLLPLFDHAEYVQKGLLSLGFCPSLKKLITPAKKILILDKDCPKKMESSITRHLEQILKKYHGMLLQKHFNTATVHEQKALEIDRFVKANFSSKIIENEKTIADLLLLSSSNLNRISRKAFGMPFHQLVIKYRMHYGLKDLLLSNKSIKEIAVTVGYEDASYFSRAFKNYFGISPTEIPRAYSKHSMN
ncbi:helix-turn-helix transcriptional regulator [Pedobacter metabolipauper]|uniref:AraC-like DNA-binding protein n=1 Tax=Pedobacter metabolipauper TaxID=425513 RepID=A0A4R6SUR3_9SPHI|nr:helix-turn-helix transcriptional regulator [Pedobacter metabolipauper]TDQ08756.1 AraC-like DNA-binding protein [Pedobacter metabolipauper]